MCPPSSQEGKVDLSGSVFTLKAGHVFTLKEKTIVLVSP